MLENISLHNMDIASRLEVADRTVSPDLSWKVELLLLLSTQSKLKNLSSREKTYLYTRDTIYWP